MGGEGRGGEGRGGEVTIPFSMEGKRWNRPNQRKKSGSGLAVNSLENSN